MACETCLAEKLASAEVKLAAIRKFASEPGNWGGMDGRPRMLIAVIDGTHAPDLLERI